MPLDRPGRFLEDEDHNPFKGQRPAAREGGGVRPMARDKFFVAQTLAQRGDEFGKIIGPSRRKQSHPNGNREVFGAVQA
jgi:hypothetical protein